MHLHPLTKTRRLICRPEGISWKNHFLWLDAFRRYEREIRSGRIPEESAGWCTAIILAYKRPQNIDLIVRAALQTPGVGKIIVSNNDPRCNLRRWLTVRHPRVRILNPKERRNVVERLVIAREEPADFFLAIDDDIFLRPEQMQVLCEAVRQNPAVLHGMFGELYSEGRVQHAQHGRNSTLDVLNRVYCFTREHVEEFFRLVDLLDLGRQETWSQNFCDDILLSFSGAGKPLCHNVGPFLDCPTQGKRGIAAWRQEQFMQKRVPIYNRLQSVKYQREGAVVPGTVGMAIPRVSVVMSVHNGMPDLEQAVTGILHQSFRDFEFLIVEDASTDETAAALERFAKEDARIRVLHNTETIGQTRSTMRALAEARGHYIARNDADDFSSPTRLEKSIAFLDLHPEANLVCTNWEWYSVPRGCSLGASTVPMAPWTIAWHLLFYNCLACQSAVMFRRRSAEQLGGYAPERNSAEDYDLWSRMAGKADVGSIPDVLVQFRRGRPESMSLTMQEVQRTHALEIAQRNIMQLIGRSPSLQEVQTMASLWPAFWNSAAPAAKDAEWVLPFITEIQHAFLRDWRERHLCSLESVSHAIEHEIALAYARWSSFLPEGHPLKSRTCLPNLREY